MDLDSALRLQARACADNGSPMYGDLCARAADDLVTGGPVASVLAGVDSVDPVGDAVALRLMGSVHRLVLQRRARDLAAYYPSVGGTWQPEAGWAAFRGLLAERPDEASAWLDRPPQTNEVGRATGLYGALLHLSRDLPVRLAEIGTSAGLNLRADRFCYVDDAGRTFGDPGSPVRLEDAWRGRALRAWPEMHVVERLGCDMRPVDVTTTEGRLLLTSYVWPDQRARLERLRAAFRVAAEVPVDVREQDALTFLEQLELAEGTTTVVQHSVVWQYLPVDARRAASARLDEMGRGATHTRRLAHVAVEPVQRDPDPEFLVTLRSWPGGEQQVLGHTVPHGVPTTWR